MDHVTALSTRDANTAPVERSRRNYCHIRVLRWIFRREGDETVVCELALTGEIASTNYAFPQSGIQRAVRSSASTTP